MPLPFLRQKIEDTIMKYGFKREVAAEIVRTFYNPEEHRRRTGRKHFLEK